MSRTVEEIKADIALAEKHTALGLPRAYSEIPASEFETHFGRDRVEYFRGELRIALTTDIPLDRLESICAAERLIGQTVYWAHPTDGVVELVCHGYHRQDNWDGVYIDSIYRGKCISFDLENYLNKRVFLTREAAEAALKGGAE